MKIFKILDTKKVKLTEIMIVTKGWEIIRSDSRDQGYQTQITEIRFATILIKIE